MKNSMPQDKALGGAGGEEWCGTLQSAVLHDPVGRGVYSHEVLCTHWVKSREL